MEFYKVGGCVRDMFMGIKPKDIDYVVIAASYDAMRNEIIARGGEIFLEKPEYLTIRARIGKEAADFVLARKDADYYDGRHPDSVEVGTLYDDLCRRDFTMNAMAMGEDGNIVDIFGGKNDIANRVIRCVRKAGHRFSEDALRMVRAMRFSVTKNMIIDPEIETCFFDDFYLSKLTAVSDDRIREEVSKMFAYNTLRTMTLFERYPAMRDVVFARNFWLMPTSKKV